MTGSEVRIAITEGLTNVRAWWRLTVPIAIIVALTAFGTTQQSLHEVDGALDDTRALDARGRQMLVVTATNGAMPGRICERARQISGVDAAFGVRPARQAETSEGSTVTLIEVTAGFLPFAIDEGLIDSGARWPVGAVAVSGSLHTEAFGVRDGALFRLADDSATAALLRAMETPRTEWFDDAVILPSPSSEVVRHCLVEPAPAARSEVIEALIGVGAPFSVVVGPHAEGLEQVRDPERRLTAAAGSLTALASAGFPLVAALGWWYARRTEWALYLLLWQRPIGLRLTVVAEWTAIIAMPMVLGWLWALALSDTSWRLSTSISSMNALATFAFALTAVPIWWVFLDRANPVRTITSV